MGAPYIGVLPYRLTLFASDVSDEYHATLTVVYPHQYLAFSLQVLPMVHKGAFGRILPTLSFG